MPLYTVLLDEVRSGTETTTATDSIAGNINSRLSINLRYPVTDEKILVSKARVTEFKEWFSVK